MSVSVLAHPLQAVLPDLAAIAAVFVLLSVGVVGMSIRNMFESIMSEEDADGEGLTGSESGGDELGGGLMDGDDGGDDDLGGLGGLEDDDLGGLGDDEFDDMDGGGGGGNVDELEHRLDELESEVGSLSSTVNTVRNENEQISESVEEVEENVRKLLDIYEMVTRGVNPFADDIDAGMGGEMGEGSFGLFADEGEDDDTVDEGVAEAEAEGFFDDDLIDDTESTDAEGGDDAGLDAGEDAFQESFDDGFGDDEFDSGESAEQFADDGDDADGGSSFEDLKAEYESGEADWAEEDSDEFADDAFDDGGSDNTGDADGEFADDELFDEVIEEDEPATAEATLETESQPEPETDTPEEPTAERSDTADEHTAEHSDTTNERTAERSDTADAPTTERPQTTDEKATDTQETTASPEAVEGGSAESVEDAAGSDDGKPYLATLPEGFAAELVVVEWLEFLVEEAGVRGTTQAVNYYEDIDWIDESVAEELQEYLGGFDGAGEGSLTIDHHTRSLEYIAQLNGDSAAASYGLDGGGSDGLQR